MAFDKPTRNRLAAFVAEARRLITDEFTQQFQSLYGISDASLTELSQLGHLDDAGLAVAGLLRERIDYLVKTHPADKAGLKAAVDRLAREQAFTVLNRLAAVRMAEKRGLIAESVGNGYQSKGFKVFEQVARSGLGEIYQRYRRYLFCLFDELAIDLGVLFDRRSPQGLLFPRENTLLDLLNLLNGPELEPLWQEDETIGWIYQYYNDPAERKKMREESAAPRNSRELAVRNQFFTPRYVVEFLTDNTLGRIWYEMTRGETRLKEHCRYLVRRPTEIFLGPEETAPELPKQEELSQEELLRQPVYIPYRDLKDPRELRMLDPACGSMHFGLYAFDLYEVIYEEAWDRGMASLRADYPDREALLREIPRLIIEHNIHGIDIDPRAVQIAVLSLWLRAQRSWQQQRLPARQRPQIRRSNIVCAEPMPGDKAMLREFIASQFAPEEQPAFTFLLERVFDRMALAGEAGSLLKIEEEISEAVREAKGLWKKGPQYTPGYLFAEAMPKQPEQLRLDLSGISDEGFWETAEERIYIALRTYAEQAEFGGYQRRLFAEDAARGFAFIDLCRKGYDLLVMNPPFGDASLGARTYLSDRFPEAKHDLAAAFVERACILVNPGGSIGCISTRTLFFLPTSEKWRRKHFSIGKLGVFADLGLDVMDAATVYAAAYTFTKSKSGESIFFRGTDWQQKQENLSLAIRQTLNGSVGNETYVRNIALYKHLPGWVVPYYLPLKLSEIFSRLESLGKLHPGAKQGIATSDDFRFVRAKWEVNELDHCSWISHTKGGEFSPYYVDLDFVLNWDSDGREVKAFAEKLTEERFGSPSWSRWINAVEYYFCAGLTFTYRSRRFGVGAMPRGSIFGVTGMGVFFHGGEDNLLEAMAVMNSSPFNFLLFMLCERRDPLFQAGKINSVPWPINVHSKELSNLAISGYKDSAYFRSVSETSPIFSGPFYTRTLEKFKIRELASEEKQQISATVERWKDRQQQIDSLVANRYEIDLLDFAILREELVQFLGDDNHDLLGAPVAKTEFEQASCMVSFILGAIFGRWDIRFATGDRPAPELPAPFASLPICPPGMLQGADGLPLSPEAGQQLRTAGHYPLDIAWDGILVDDPGHPLDLDHCFRDVFTVLWHDRTEAIEQEACEILGVKSLRDYFHKPSGFFADHLKRYSKSRRQAPIYWPLSSAKGSYTLWIYYHRLSDQTLHTALADFVDPKIKDVRAEISLLRESNNNRSRLEELLDLESELLDFQAEIERIIKLPWQPNLNDGVLITAAPLWRLFRLPKWQKDLKACWDKLEKGEYDWAHLAYSIWPKRVEEVCKKDRSIAIAHGLEHLCQVEPPKPKAKRGRKKAE